MQIPTCRTRLHAWKDSYTRPSVRQYGNKYYIAPGIFKSAFGPCQDKAAALPSAFSVLLDTADNRYS